MESQRPPKAATGTGTESLESWKAIAGYLKRDERTVRRWEQEGLPVHRHMHKKKASIYAYKSEIDAWWQRDRLRLEAGEASTTKAKRRLGWWVAGAALALVLVGFTVGGLQDRLLDRSGAEHIASIAVLPLKNLSPDSEQDVFADGMTEALITHLGKISAFDVISHQSMLNYRGVTKPLPQIARELNVKAVIEGTVLRAGDKVRITANLIQASPERHLWAESYEVDRRDILAVQDLVARQVVSHVHARLTPDEYRRLSTARSVDPDAYEAYLLGRAYFYKPRTRANATRAREYFEKAIAKDPTYAPIYASLAELYIWTGGAGTLTQEKSGDGEAHELARKWAEKALALDDNVADAHNALAMVKQARWDWDGAEREYQRALELNHSHAVAHISYAMHLYGMQRFSEAVVHARRAQQLDPAAPLINTWAAAAYFFAERDDDAVHAVRKALEFDPGYYDATLVFARNLIAKRNYDRAIAELNHALALNAKDPAILAALAHAHARAGNREAATKLLTQLKSNGAAPRGSYPTFPLIWVYAGLGNNDEAFAWLERACAEHRQRLTWLNVDPLLEPIRADARFGEIVRRIGLPAPAPNDKARVAGSI